MREDNGGDTASLETETETETTITRKHSAIHYEGERERKQAFIFNRVAEKESVRVRNRWGVRGTNQLPPRRGA